MTKEKQHHKIEWFDKLRLNSWEVEILIVGFVLVMLFQLPDTLAYEASRIWNSSELDSEYSFLITGSQGFTFLTIGLCVQILIYSFSIYLALRGFWVGILGLSSVYPDGINLKKLNFNDKFISIIKKYNFNQFIISVDNICSTIFSFSFLLSFSIISLLIFCFQLFLLIMSIATLSDIFPQGSIYEAIIEILLIVYIVFGLIFFIDHFFFSVFKKIKWKFLKIPFYYINRFYHYATLVFIYDQLYYAFISNIKKRIILFVFFCYIAFTSFFEPLNEYYFFPEAGMVSYDIMQYFYYEDEFINIEKGDEEAFPEEPFINSTIITSNYLKLYIPYNPDINISLKKQCADVEYINNADSYAENADQLLDCINNGYTIYIDDSKISSDFIFYFYPYQYGNIKTFFTIIPLDDFSNGRHTITINKKFGRDFSIDGNIIKIHGEESEVSKTRRIPFYLQLD